jgi:hypothetical protein
MPLSGVLWTHRFAASTSLDDLEPNFQHVSADFLTPFRPHAPGWRTPMWLHSQMSMPDPEHETTRHGHMAWREQREPVPSPGFTTPTPIRATRSIIGFARHNAPI